jgi:hypothetical protein
MLFHQYITRRKGIAPWILFKCYTCNIKKTIETSPNWTIPDTKNTTTEVTGLAMTSILFSGNTLTKVT